MLIELYSDAFKRDGKVRPKISFHKGLNVVIGGQRRTNSIGKSTFLMILDFVFGGEDYTSENIQNIKEVGPHVIKFAFQTGKGIKYFSRATLKPKMVSVCDENYHELKTISLNEYRKELLSIYHINIPDTSFRGMVSNFIRVHPRTPSKVTDAPLQAAEGQSKEQQITNFEKLFQSYKEIDALKKEYDNVKEKSKVLTAASKFEFVKPAKNKTTFVANEAKIKEFNSKIQEIENQAKKATLDIDIEKDDSTRELVSHINGLRDQRSRLKLQVLAIQRNLDIKINAQKKSYQALSEFFPGLDTKRLDEIEEFHSGLIKILKNEFKASIKEIQGQISLINQSIQALEDKVKEIKGTSSISLVVIEKVSRYKAEVDKLNRANQLYEEERKLKKEKDENKKCWDEAVKNGLNDSQYRINKKMQEMNVFVCGSESIFPPILDITDGRHYTFNTSADTGKGSADKGTILFDLACLELSELPFLVHDSHMFSDIEIDRFQNIVKLYSKYNKQVFISVDKIGELDEDVRRIIEENCVLKLGRGGDELFGRTWGLDKKKED